jgi:bifunctional non-homologous end joining protein LigD
MKTIEPKTGAEQSKIGKFTVTLTNLHKIWWPEEGYTNADVIAYYDSIADYIIIEN